MGNTRLTDWLDCDAKPALPGVYQRDHNHPNAMREDRWIGRAFSYWNGEYWGLFDQTIDGAVGCARIKAINQRLPWRGLSQPPKQYRATAQEAAIQLTQSSAKGGDLPFSDDELDELAAYGINAAKLVKVGELSAQSACAYERDDGSNCDCGWPRKTCREYAKSTKGGDAVGGENG